MYSRTMVASVVEGRRLWAFGAVLAGSWLLAASSWIEVPMWPVPITAQSYAVVLIGAVCGLRLAAATVVAYLVEGAIGLPVFAGGGGFAHLIGPTGGYLVGFLFAAALVGALVDRGWGRSLSALTAAMTLGHVVILALGTAYLASFVGLQSAVDTGVTPFVIGSVIKIFAAVATVRALERARQIFA